MNDGKIESTVEFRFNLEMSDLKRRRTFLGGVFVLEGFLFYRGFCFRGVSVLKECLYSRGFWFREVPVFEELLLHRGICMKERLRFSRCLVNA